MAGFAMIVIAAIGWRYLNSGTATPSDGQSKSMVEVEIPQFDQSAKMGEVKFDQYCASCHGNNAAGQESVAPPLVHIIYEPGHHGDGSFLRAAKQGVRAHHWPFGDMPPVDGIDDNDVTLIIAYVRALQRANGIR